MTAAVASPLLLLLIFWAPAWSFAAIVLLAIAAGSWEVFSMTHPLDPVARWLGVGQSLLLALVLYCFSHDHRVVLAAVWLSTIAGLLIPLWRLGDIPTAGARLMAGVAVPLYLSMLVSLALLHREVPGQGPYYVLMTFMFAWMGDTGGYFCGRFLGRHKLHERVSPKKTREGFFGAVAGSVLGGLLAHFWYLPTIPLIHAVSLGALCGMLGQLGDLAESLLKRATAVKDSSQLVPGHGGVLDRIDALLVVSPLVYLYAVMS